ncbi:MAG: DDE-type integrase/transposase/recombinase [Acidobacteriaceae bacterium]|nr:DDE-type integrase/transposase/recombinase [Acidobacteriaceae bacterium]
MHNRVEQDHRIIKRRTRLAMGYGSFRTAWRTLQGLEAMHRMNQGRVRWLAQDNVRGQRKFVHQLFGIAI